MCPDTDSQGFNSIEPFTTSRLAVIEQNPRLSICLATYNASHLLRVTLGDALPQVAATEGRVELLVVDDASTDDTSVVVEEARKHGPIRYIRNKENLGVNGNLVHGPTRHAKGEYIWVWNQHCLLFPGALNRLLDVLGQNQDLDVFYANFRCARYPEDWPEKAEGGYDGPFQYLSNLDTEDRQISRWQDLLDAKTSLCTQSYAHIVRHEIWTNYWQNRTLGESFRDALSTYPHTCMLVESVANDPSFYIGGPLITIFNGAQSWKCKRANVHLKGIPDLFTYFRRADLPKHKLRDAQGWGRETARAEISAILQNPTPENRSLVWHYIQRYTISEGALLTVCMALLASDAFWFSRFFDRVKAKGTAIISYLFYNCRPARWIRGQIRSY